MSRVEELTKDFDTFLACAKLARQTFTGPSEYFYSRINDLHEKHALEELLENDAFYEYLYATLATWGMHRMGKGGAKMKEFEPFKANIQSCAEELLLLKDLYIEKSSSTELEDAGRHLSTIFDELDVMKTKAKLVANSKILHFLLPNLVVPIDREYTLWFFEKRLKANAEDERNLFLEIFKEFAEVSRKLDLKNQSWQKDSFQPSAAKLMDNAIIGFKQRSKKPEGH